MRASSSKPLRDAPRHALAALLLSISVMPIMSAWSADTLNATAATVTANVTANVKPEKSIAMMDFELIDETGDDSKSQAQQARLQAITRQLKSAFETEHLYRVVDTTPAKALITDLQNRFSLHDCNGCDVDIGKALNTDRILTAWVQKVSNLILNINIQIRDVATGNIMLNKSVDIRSNTDESWQRGIRYMVRSMVEKNQANR